MADKEGRYSPIHAVLGGADEVHELTPDESKTNVVHVGKGLYHKTKMHGGVAFKVEVEFEVEVGGRLSYANHSPPPSPIVTNETQNLYGGVGNASTGTEYSVTPPALFATVVLPSSQEKIVIPGWYDPPRHRHHIVVPLLSFLLLRAPLL